MKIGQKRGRSQAILRAATTSASSSDAEDEEVPADDAYLRLLKLSSCSFPTKGSPVEGPSGIQEGSRARLNEDGEQRERDLLHEKGEDVVEEEPLQDTFDLHLDRTLSNADVVTLLEPAHRRKQLLLTRGWKHTCIQPHCEIHGFFKLDSSEIVPAPLQLPSYGVHNSPPSILCTFPIHVSGANCVGLNARLAMNLQAVHSTDDETGNKNLAFSSRAEASFFALCNKYFDVMHTCCPYRTEPSKLSSEEAASILHAANHVLKKMEKVKQNNDKIEAGSIDNTSARDQGFVRPLVLFLAPMRSIALDIVLRFLALAQREQRHDAIQGKSRFMNEFSDEAVPEKRKGIVRPEDHKALFHGNSDDHFKFGIKVTQGSVKLFSDIFDSDVIVASPLALATSVQEPDSTIVDSLSSIEVAIVFRADVMMMQNWTHVQTVFEALNKLPSEQHGTDLMRVRPHFLDEQAKLYRQSILFSSFEAPEINLLAGKLCNYEGLVTLTAKTEGVLSCIASQVHHLYQKFVSPSSADIADCRFDYFTKHVWPRLADARAPGVLLFVSSYFDFVRLRNFLKDQGASFAEYCEYTSGSNVLRARMRFSKQERQVMLYTERAHFFFRPHLKGVQEVVFYSLPQHAAFYEELVNMLSFQTSDHQRPVQALFTSCDYLALKRIVGCERAARMVKQKSTSFLFKME